jgi:serine/threonine-protein kinase
MTPERWRLVSELFQAALDRPAGEREAFVAEACGSDEALRRELSSLVAADGGASGFLEPTSTRLDEAALTPTADDGEGADEALLEPGHRLGPYEVRGVLGVGGMGQVYRAHDPRLRRDVAVKVLSPSRRSPDESRRLEREARAAAALAHPNLLAVLDVGRDGDLHYVVSELLEGETLRERLEAGPLPQVLCLDYARQIVAGLRAAHDKGIVHRDLKPDNLFVTREGRVKILDFGLAKRAPGIVTGAPGSASATWTEPGAVLGTVGYMSPEQVRGQAVDERSDVFSFGVVLFEMLTGRRAFSRESPVETMSAILVEDPPGLERLPPGPGAIVRRCLEKAMDRRFPSSRALAAALDLVSDASGPVLPHFEDRRVSIAVLPFVDLSPERDQEYLCEGMAEELMAALRGIEGLRVAARSSAFRFRGPSRDPRRVGSELGVRKVLEGSVRRSRDRVRVAVQLLDTEEGFQVWSERYDRPAEDMLALQGEIAERVVESLRPQLGTAASVAPGRDMRDPEAHHLYLKGRYHWNRRHQGGLRKGLEAFEQTIAKDPGHALAHAGLADSWSVLGYYGLVRPREAFARARPAAERAVALDDLLPEAHVARGLVHSWFDWDWEAAEDSFLRALTLRADHVPALWFLGHLHAVRGRREEAAACTRRAADLEPVSPVTQANAGHIHYLAHRMEDALLLCGRALELDPGHPVALFTSALASSRLGRHAEALAAAEEVTRLGERAAFFEGVAGLVEARAGKEEEARERVLRLRERADREYVPALSLAQIYAALGEREEAFAWLERAYEERNPYLSNLEAEPWPAVRGDPRFADLVRRLRLGPEAAVAPARPVPAIAVLPFRNLSADAESTHLELGLAEATIVELARLRSLMVRPISSVIRYRDSAVEPRQAGRELAVDAVVDGGFQRAEGQLRVTVNLVSTADGRSLWASKIDVSLDDLFRMQDEVSGSIARALAVELRPKEDRPTRRGARAPGAYEMYLKGREHLQRETLPDFIAAVDAFQQARDADPTFALAYAALADAYERIGFQFQPEGDWYGRAVEMCERALALDPALPEGHYARGRLRWSPGGGWDNAGALRDLLTAIAGRPDLDEALDRLGVILYHVGLVDEGLAALQRVLTLSPGHAQARYHVGFCRYHQGRYEEGFAVSEAVGRLAPASWIYYQTGLCELRLGRLDAVERTVEIMERQTPGEAMVHPLLGLVAMMRGQEAEAREQVRRTVEKRRAFGHYHHALYDMTCIVARFGEAEEALGYLREAARSGYPCVSLFERDPLLDPLRARPEFQEMLAALRAERDGYARLYAELRRGA